MDMERQQQEQQQVNWGVLEAIASLERQNQEERKHQLVVLGIIDPPIDRYSWQYLVDFLDGVVASSDSSSSHVAVVTDLEIMHVWLPDDPPDGSLNVLCTFFARSDTTLTKSYANGFLQRLECSECVLRVDGVRAFQPGLRSNQTLKQLILSDCDIRDEGIRLMMDSLIVGNTSIEVLNISENSITSNGLDDITRLIESTRVHTIQLGGIYGIFGNEASTQRFTHFLSTQEFLKELNLNCCRLGDGGIHLIVNSLVGNTTMEILGIQYNNITFIGLNHIIRLLESTRLHTMRFGNNPGVFDNENATKNFAVGLGEY